MHLSRNRSHRRRTIQTFVFSAMLAVAMVALFGTSARAQTPAGTVSVVTGDVQIIRAGTTIKAAVGTPVEVGDQLKTGPGANVAVMLSDKSRFELGESSQMTIDQHTVGAGTSTTRLGLALGVVRNWVVHVAGGNAANYEVHTPNAVGAARGTTFDVQYQDNATRNEFKGCKQFTDVAVYEDSVDLSNPTAPGNEHVTVPAGHKSTVPCALVPLAPVVIGAATAATLGGDTAAAGAVAGAAVTAGGVLGGLAGTGAFSSNTNPASPSK
jgi:FecR protein